MTEALAVLAGAQAAWGRLFHLFGSNEHPARLVPSLIRPLLQGQRATCRAGQHERDFLHVADLGDALAALVLGTASGPVNLGSGQRWRLGDFAREIGRVIGRPDLVNVEVAEDTPQNPRMLVPDLRRLQDEVGWQCRSALQVRLQETIGWWRAQGASVDMR